MKLQKVTSIILAFFFGVVLTVYGYGLIFAKDKAFVQSTAPTTRSSTPANGTTSPTPTGLTAAEVAKHSTPSDCYLIINSKVYNVSTYIGLHPGGVRNITSKCGSEVTGIFAAIHSNFAWDLLKKYYIGDVGQAVAATGTTTTVDSTLTKYATILQQAYPGSEVVNVQPKLDYYIAKIIYQGKLYEIHLDSSGHITKQELQNAELDWNNWSTDSDDN
ncbi:MAG: cytochrome b5 domain-containing protein [Patescibacteria group bacterium]